VGNSKPTNRVFKAGSKQDKKGTEENAIKLSINLVLPKDLR
jgi:hypothetical protein